MMSWFVIFVLIAADDVSAAATSASLQSDGETIYDISQTMSSLVTVPARIRAILLDGLKLLLRESECV